MKCLSDPYYQVAVALFISIDLAGSLCSYGEQLHVE